MLNNTRNVVKLWASFKKCQKKYLSNPVPTCYGPILLLLLLHTDVCPPQFPITDLRAKREGEKETETDRQTVDKKELYCFQVAFPCAFVGIQQRQSITKGASHVQKEDQNKVRKQKTQNCPCCTPAISERGKKLFFLEHLLSFSSSLSFCRGGNNRLRPSHLKGRAFWQKKIFLFHGQP